VIPRDRLFRTSEPDPPACPGVTGSLGEITGFPERQRAPAGCQFSSRAGLRPGARSAVDRLFRDGRAKSAGDATPETMAAGEDLPGSLPY